MKLATPEHKLNRAQRRRLEKMDRISVERLKREIVSDTVKEIQHTEDEFLKAEDERTTAIYACSILALHNVFGYDQAECIEYANEIDRIMGEIINDGRTIDSILKELEYKLNIIIKP